MGQKFKVILIEQESIAAKKAKFFEFVEKQAFKLPEDYKFDRDELYNR